MKNENKQIAYNDYLKLKNAFLELQEKYKKLKTENNELKKYLNEFKDCIPEYESSKNNIYSQVREVQIKYNLLLEKYKSEKNNLNKTKNFHIEKFNFLFKGKNDNIYYNYKELNERYKSLKEEHNKTILNKLCSNSESTNMNTKIDNSKFICTKNILDFYINSINFGYDNNNNINNNENNFNNINNNNIEIEPTPTFLKCLKKINI
jgi:hypothetical protein